MTDSRNGGHRGRRMGKRLGLVALASLAVAAACGIPDVGREPPRICVRFPVGHPAPPPTQVDLLFVVDDGPGMAAKADRLASGLAPFLGFLARTDDVHVGVIASSLGGMGGDVCPDDGPTNGRAHLRTRGPGGAVVPAAAEHGFLAFDRTTYDLPGFTRDVQALLRGVGEEGCRFSSPLEAAYRFLVQPDPWERITVDGSGRARPRRNRRDRDHAAARVPQAEVGGGRDPRDRSRRRRRRSARGRRYRMGIRLLARPGVAGHPPGRHDDGAARDERVRHESREPRLHLVRVRGDA